MDLFEKAFIDFWMYLNQYQVRFIIVGGFAVNFQGFQRYTGDVDLYLEDTLENRKRFRKAYAEYGMGDYPSIETMQFVPGWVEFSLSNNVKLDIQTSLKGVEESFSKCLELATVAVIDEAKIHFLHINHLLANKRAVNHLKDQLDVIELEKVKKLRGE